MSTYTATAPLSSAAISLIKRAATNKSFDLDYSIVPQVNGDRGSVGITLSEKIRSKVSGAQQTVDSRWEIPALRNVTNHGSTRGDGIDRPLRRYVTSARAYVSSPESNPFVTLATVARVGDELRVRFVLGNNTESLRSVGFTHDECYIDIVRRGKIIATVLVDEHTVPEHNVFAGFLDPSWKGEPWATNDETLEVVR